MKKCYDSLSVLEGRVKVIYELGSGLGEVTSNRRIDDGQPHNIRVSRNGNFVTLVVDEDTVDGQSEGFLSKLNAKGNIYIGKSFTIQYINIYIY